jgi:phenylalanyl-tRNA synthetase beta chain
VAWLELDLTVILNLEPAIPQWQPVSRYPSSDIDLAFIVDDDTTADDLRTAIAGAAGPLLIDVDLFDVYRGAGIPAGHRSLAFRIRLQAADHTLTDAEAATVREVIIAAAAAKGATLRG